MPSHERIALITGAGTGIGRASAIALAAAGFSVTLVGRKRSRLDEVAHDITAAGHKVLVLCADITEEAQVENAFALATSHYGRLDLLFNNAGTSAPKACFDEVELRHFNRVIATNLTGAFLCARSAFRQMKRQAPCGGRIINNGSVSAHVPRPNGAAYTASKHGVTGLTRQISLDGRAFDIACGQIDIGNADTGVADALAAGMLQPNGRIVPEPVMPIASVADAVVFMAGLPISANVQFMTIMATSMPYIGRG